MSPAPSSARPGRSEDLALVATGALREMIASGELAGGLQIRQAELAARIGVSRSPLREALRALEQEGLLQHEPNRGYFVTRLSRAELEQIYRMRTLLERELLDTAAPADAETVAHLRAHNDAISEAMTAGSIVDVLRSNMAFHFAIFELSPLALVRREVLRLWQLSAPYQAAYLRHPASRQRVADEHTQIIEAAAAGDATTLAKLLDAHRDAASENVLGMLP